MNVAAKVYRLYCSISQIEHKTIAERYSTYLKCAKNLLPIYLKYFKKYNHKGFEKPQFADRILEIVIIKNLCIGEENFEKDICNIISLYSYVHPARCLRFK